MTRAAYQSILLSFLLLSLSNAGGGKQTSPGKDEIVTVEYCDLISHPALYDGKELRLRGVYSVSGKIISHFFSSACGSGISLWVDFDPSYSSCTKPSLVKRLDEMTRKSGIRWGRPHVTVVEARFRNAEVLFVGKFRATNPHKRSESGVEPATPAGSFFKHQEPKENYDYVFSVSCVEQIKPLPKNAKF